MSVNADMIAIPFSLPACQNLSSPENENLLMRLFANARQGDQRMRSHGSKFSRIGSILVVLGALLGGCAEEFQQGYIIPEGALEQIPIGASQDQVLIVMGTPSTVATLSGEVFYYISQRAQRRAAFMPRQLTDQRVIAIYFDKTRHVERLANYGLKDGKIFDYVSRTTPTGGQEMSYLTPLFRLLKGGD